MSEQEKDGRENGPPAPEKCPGCDGCGLIASGEEGAPWSFWMSLPPGLDLAVRAGIVKPIPCPDCGGTGEKRNEHAE
jgi:hypothetical protein